MIARFHYHPESDSLIIANKAEGEKVKRNFMFDDFVISISSGGKILAIEIREVSVLLKQMGINPHILETLEDAQLIIMPKKYFIYIGFVLLYKVNNKLVEQKIPITHLPVLISN